MTEKYFEFHDKLLNHHKFWAIDVKGNKVIRRWGRVGSKGQTKVDDLNSFLTANMFEHNMIVEKEGEGYVKMTSPLISKKACPHCGNIESVEYGSKRMCMRCSRSFE